MQTMTQLLTFSRMDTFKTCRKKEWFSYTLRIRPKVSGKALRMGTGFHNAQEALHNSGSLADACNAVYRCYAQLPAGWDAYEWAIEAETVVRMVCGYVWRWQAQTFTNVASEQVFTLPLINPETGRESKTFQLAGKIDGIVRLEDGRLAVIEHKLLSDDLGSDSQLWRRLTIDHQITLYVLAARRLGYPVESVIYNVTRKPTIQPTPIPLTDANGVKVVLDASKNRVYTKAGEYRQTGDTARGYVLQTRLMTPEEWGEKLSADIAERPDHYFIRNEIARLDKDIEEYEVELWDIAKTIREAQVNDRHFRTVNRNTCPYCPFFGLCVDGFDINHLPEHFEILADPHPELNQGDSHGSTTSATGSKEAGASADALTATAAVS